MGKGNFGRLQCATFNAFPLSKGLYYFLVFAFKVFPGVFLQLR